MSKPVVEVQVRAVAATTGGCAVFLGNEDKVFVMFVDQSVGTAITMFMQGMKKERPLTHDLLANILRALGANDIKDPGAEEPQFDPYTFTLPTQAGPKV